MQLSFVVLTRDRPERAQRTVGRLRSLHPSREVVVVDNGSAEPLAGLGPDAVVVRLEEDGGAAARNVGARAASSEVVAFCDDDAWWALDAPEAALERLAEDGGLAGVVGRVLVEPGGRLDPVSALHEREGRVTGFQATALVVRRSAFLGVGGFHRHFRIGAEEELLAMQLLSAGWRLEYEPRAVLHHAPTPKAHHTRSHRPTTEPRNRLWTAWLRRPLPTAARETARILAADRSPRVLAQAAVGLPWVLRERDVNPPEVERLYD